MSEAADIERKLYENMLSLESQLQVISTCILCHEQVISVFKSLYRVACSVRDWSSTGPCAIKYNVKSKIHRMTKSNE